MNVTDYWSDGLTLRRTIIDNGNNTAVETLYDEQGQQLSSQTIAWDSTPIDENPVTSAVEAARSAVAGLSENSSTRKAVEALANAVEGLQL